MKFGRTPSRQAVGAVLAHSLKQNGVVFKKGRRLGAEDVAALIEAGVDEIVAAQLEPGDLGEDAAAAALLKALAPDPAGAGLVAGAPFTGRANLFAAGPGLLTVDAARIDAANAVHEAVTIATLPAFSWVAPRAMAATVKIIPYAAPEAAVAEAARRLGEGDGPALAIRPLARPRMALISTVTPGFTQSALSKGEAAVQARVTALGAELVETRRAPHEAPALAEALRAATGDLVLVLTASATSDPRDVAPAAILAAGGRLERVGMPVDPGNLLVVGDAPAPEGGAPRPVIGLPGCARSPKLNGADWVLERLAAGVAVSSQDIAAMGVGGLLKEIPSRPQPRGGRIVGGGARARVSALLMAAGGSRRMGLGRHKLLETVDGAPLALRAAKRLAAATVDEVVAVVGARADDMRAALAPAGVRIVEAPRWEAGMAESLRAAVAAMDPQADAALVALADMPEVSAPLVDALIAAFDPEEGREIIRPVAVSGRPGHPVLFGRRFFEALAAQEGDRGARAVIDDNRSFLVDVPWPDAAPEVDLDTPEDWDAWRARR